MVYRTALYQASTVLCQLIGLPAVFEVSTVTSAHISQKRSVLRVPSLVHLYYHEHNLFICSLLNTVYNILSYYLKNYFLFKLYYPKFIYGVYDIVTTVYSSCL